ncbi:MAG: squalene/phytoene synthase family protein [Bacteroidales bacterium]|nr:squalene/phytoene synthase family protein [Bacteroidales bacterium]
MDHQKEKFLQIFNSLDFNKITDHPNILIAASFFDPDRYCAAKSFYKFMRAIDDLIDNHKAVNRRIVPEERMQFEVNVNNWLKMIQVAEDCPPDQKELTGIMERFRIPHWPLESFARSMIYDINNDGFASLKDFFDYAQGASVAPASIFVHLAGLTEQNGNYSEPVFDVRESATPCAIFSYLVHIIRDFQKDQLANLNYFAEDLTKKYSLSKHDLREIAYGHPAGSNFRNLVEEYLTIADEYRIKTFEVIKKIRPLMTPRYQLSLDIIFELYLMVYERIDVVKGNFSAEELNPSPEETRKRVYDTIMNFPSD